MFYSHVSVRLANRGRDELQHVHVTSHIGFEHFDDLFHIVISELVANVR